MSTLNKDSTSFPTSHTFCESWDRLRSSDFLKKVPTVSEVFFAWFMTTWKKKISTRAIGIQKENWGQHIYFFYDQASIWGKIHALFIECFFLQLLLVKYL